MKKIFLIAASAMMVFASCQKVDVIYENTNPQEIAMFAVNKNMTKAPVSGTNFLDTDNMRVSAYLASVAGSTPASYFENILFAKGTSPETMWVAGQYWPISAATLNFVAVTQIGGGVGLDASKIVWTNTSGQEKFTVTVDYNVEANETANPVVPQTIKQSDIMYACNRAKNNGDGTGAPDAVGMKFQHALAWINFAFKSNVTEAGLLTVNSVELYAPYNDTLTVTPENYTKYDDSELLSVKAAWKEPAFLNLKVTNQNNGLAAVIDLADQADEADLANLADQADQADQAKYTAFGEGMLVVPYKVEYSEDNPQPYPYFVINYSIKQGTEVKAYSYKHDLLTVDWEMGKKYTYNISINLNEIKVNPYVEVWDDKDEKGTDVTTDDENWGAVVPLG